MSEYPSEGPSATVQRLVKLLAKVMPLFPPVLAERFEKSRRHSQERRSWTRFQTPFTEMGIEQEKGWRFQRLGNDHKQMITTIIEELEELLDMAPSDDCKFCQYPRLETLGSCSEGDAIKALRDCLGLPSEVAQPKLFRALGDLRSTFDGFNDPIPPEAMKAIPETLSLVVPRLIDALSTLAKRWCINCHPGQERQAALILPSHCKISAGHDDLPFEILLSPTPKTRESGWREASIKVNEIARNLVATQIAPQRKMVQWAHSTNKLPSAPRVPVADLCSVIGQGKGLRLNFDITNGTLFMLPKTDLEFSDLIHTRPITLAEGFLSTEQKSILPRIPVCLALVLSYSLFQHCMDSSPVRHWDKTSIYLMQSSTALSLVPMLISKMPKDSGHMDCFTISRASFDSRLLMHAILMMEIFTQSALSIPFTLPVDIESLRHEVRNLAGKIDWGVHDFYLQSVNYCIGGLSQNISASKLELDLMDPDVIKVYNEMVISPLESEFRSLWGKKAQALNTIMSIKLPTVRPNVKPKPANLRTLKSTSFRREHDSPVVGHRPMNRLQRDLKLFDVNDGEDSREIQGACRWLEECEASETWAKMPARPRGKPAIRIAILDTGIDLNNPTILNFAGRIKCWPGVASCHDKDGHGTQVAYLISRLAPHAQLHIARVSSSSLLRDVEIANIEQAITHFSSSENRVDIINMSFGFMKFEERLRPVLRAIRRGRESGVLFFAAAGNGGGNHGVAWPASLRDSGDVIRIDSSDRNGNMSTYSPGVGQGPKIHTLGEGLPSCEPLPDPRQGVICRSGTSFATPIAAAIAAIVLGVMENASITAGIKESLPEDYEVSLGQLRTRIGMESVLCDTCTRQNPSDNTDKTFYITPWHFLDREEYGRVHVVLNILRSLPE